MTESEYKTVIKLMIEKLERHKDEIAEQQVEIDRLKAEAQMADGYEDALVEYTKEKAIKEFAERLKGEMLGKYCVYFNFEISNAIIDNLVKEMCGDPDA